MNQNHFIRTSTSDIISPPNTPKRNIETSFYSNDSHSSVYSCFMDYSPPYSPLTVNTAAITACLQQKLLRSYSIRPNSSTAWINGMYSFIPSHRRKQRPSSPIRSPSKTTFTLPIEPIIKRQKIKKSSCNNDHTLSSNQKKKQKYKRMNCATTKVSRLAKQDVKKPKDTCQSSLYNSLLDKPQNIVYHDQKNTVFDSPSLKQDTEIPLICKPVNEESHFFDNTTVQDNIEKIFKGKEDWIPKNTVFDNRAAIRISWKGSPLKIQAMQFFDKLHPGEIPIAATLRLTPEQYLKCKYALILAAHKAFQDNALFRKSEAQKACGIDVNKSSVLWKVFGKLGWLGSKWPK